MQQKVLGRLLIIVGVVIFSIYYLVPSARLILFRLTADKPTAAQIKQRETWRLPGGAAPVRFGLDLQGGTDVTLQIDSEALIREILESQRRDIFSKMRAQQIALSLSAVSPQAVQSRSLTASLTRQENAREAALILGDFADVFEISNTDALARPGGQVVLRLRDNVLVTRRDEAIEAAWRVIRRRVDVQGLVQPVVVREGEDRIRVQMPGVENPQEVVDNIIRPAQLEFRLLHEKNDELVRQLFTPEALAAVEKHIAEFKKLPDPLPLSPDADIPLGYEIVPGEYSDESKNRGPAPQVRYLPYVVRQETPVRGDELRDAYVQQDLSDLRSPWKVGLRFSRAGAVAFFEITRNNVGQRLAILLDGFLYSAPVIRQPIPNGSAVIEGTFTRQEVVNLSLVLKAGALPADFNVLQSSIVEATLGVDSIRKGILSLLIGSLVVIIFLMFYYRTSGIIATAALLVNVFLVAALVAISRATLTLSGIAGVLLTVGMADDANVLINERIREESGASRGVKAAISKGFGRAFSVIFDSNVTTLVVALVLLQFGTGSVQGFAVTLTFGIFATLFSGLFVTHTLTDLWVQYRNHLNTGTWTLFKNPRFDFIRLRYFGYAFSLTLMLIGALAIISRGGVQWGVEFTGGVRADLTFAKPTSEDQIKTALASALGATPIVQRVRGDENRFIVRVKSEEGRPIEQIESGMRAALDKAYGPRVATVGGLNGISNEVGGEFVRQALVAVFIACIGILIYLAFRFEWIFGAGAVIALFHDVLITFGLLHVFGQEISLDVVAALLTVIGYSVNDTIVIFDRIRETLRNTYGLPYKDILNNSINQSLNRTTITVLTTLFTTIIMWIFGGPGLRGLAMTLTIGIIKGTYSSSFVATPLLFEYHQYRRRRHAKAGTEVATAR